MCGIVAALAANSNGFTNDEVKAFTDMLFVNTQRGWDSTGVFGVSNLGNVAAHKAALMGPQFITTPEYKAFAESAFRIGSIMVGHNRAATRGTVDDKNAHPFWVDDNIFLVHNGTWNGDHSHVKKTEVDSEAIAHLLAEHEDEEEALQKINAAYALMWYNVKKKKLFAIRNMQRPLCVGYAKNGTILLASEISTIIYAAMRQGIQLKDKPYEIEHGMLCSWESKPNGGFEFEDKKVNYHYKGGSSNSNFHSAHYSQWPLVGYDDVEDVEPVPRKDQISNTISEIVSRGTFPDNEYTTLTAHGLVNEFTQTKKKKLIIEWIDYIKGNEHKDCSVFYLIGNLVTPNAASAPPLPIFYTIKNGEEWEILNMIGNLYEVEPATGMVHPVHKTGSHVATVFVSHLLEIKSEEETSVH